MIKFIMVDIKDINLIYDIREIKSIFLPEIVVKSKDYIADRYYEQILDEYKESGIINSYTYKRVYDRFAKECYGVFIDEEEYELIFTLDTLKNHIELTVEINKSNSKDKYDFKLENLKILIKDELLKQWNKCIWIKDKQSEELSIQLYGTLHRVENKMRELVNSVLLEWIGIHWNKLVEFNELNTKTYTPKRDFERISPNFKSIDSTLLSMTTSELYDVMRMKIYKNTFKSDLDDAVLWRFKEHIFKYSPKETDLRSQTVKILDDMYNIEIDLWKDVFENLFDNPDNAKKIINDFIKNRNHIAHNKLVDNATFQKMDKNSELLNDIFDNAIDKLNELLISEEQEETLQIQEIDDYRESECLREIKSIEAGVKIRVESEIEEYFSETLDLMYEDIYDECYFNPGIEFSDTKYSSTSDKTELFSVVSSVNTADNIIVYRTYQICDGEGEESYILLEANQGIKTILSSEVSYKNGEASFNDEQMIYMPESYDEMDFDELENFKYNLIDFINEEMNSLKKSIDDSKYTTIKEGGELPVYNIPCVECGEEYISKDENVYEVGKCINCGAENEISICIRCNSEYESNGSEFCDFCIEKIEKE